MTDSEIKITSGQGWIDARDAGEPEHWRLYGGDLVATLEYEGRVAKVVVVGDMRYRDREGHLIIRNGSDLNDHGITTDAQLNAAMDNGDLVCDNNPWYEVWVGDHDYSEPCFSQSECLEAAELMLRWPLDTNSSL